MPMFMNFGKKKKKQSDDSSELEEKIAALEKQNKELQNLAEKDKGNKDEVKTILADYEKKIAEINKDANSGDKKKGDIKPFKLDFSELTIGKDEEPAAFIGRMLQYAFSSYDEHSQDKNSRRQARNSEETELAIKKAKATEGLLKKLFDVDEDKEEMEWSELADKIGGIVRKHPSYQDTPDELYKLAKSRLKKKGDKKKEKDSTSNDDDDDDEDKTATGTKGKKKQIKKNVDIESTEDAFNAALEELEIKDKDLSDMKA